MPYWDMNGSGWQCGGLGSDIQGIFYGIITIPFSIIVTITCVVTLILVCVLKLHKTQIYRLAMYQVLSALVFSILWIVVSINPTVTLVVVIGALLLGSMVMKLMFTVWIVIHLFALAVFHKKLQRLEPLYVASSLLIPLMVTAVILPIGVVEKSHITSKYACMIEDIMFTIVFGVLVFTSWLIITMGTVLCHRACRRRNLVLSDYDKQHKKALCEIVPLLLYPILFLLLITPIFVISVRDITRPEKVFPSGLIFSIFAPIWSFTTSMSLIYHLCVVRHLKKTRLIRKALRYNRGQQLREEALVTVNQTTRLCQRSDTHYTARTED